MTPEATPNFIAPQVVECVRKEENRVTRGDYAQVCAEAGLMAWLSAALRPGADPPGRGTHPMSGLPLGIAVEAAIAAVGGKANGLCILRAMECSYESPAPLDAPMWARATVKEVGLRHAKVDVEVHCGATSGDEKTPAYAPPLNKRTVLRGILVLVRVGEGGNATSLADLTTEPLDFIEAARATAAAAAEEVEDELAGLNTDLVQAAFDLDTVEMSGGRLHEMLASRIREMLTDSFDQLLGILYRVDVSEERAREAMQHGDLDGVAEELAHLVLERHVEKLRARRGGAPPPSASES